MAATCFRSSRTRSFLLRVVLAIGAGLVLALLSRAGGPEFVAGTSYFLPTTSGQPLTWPQGLVTYYTDQGDLSPIEPGASADALVADAWSKWTSISTAAVAANSGGHLAEDVNGSNVILKPDGTITMPADIQPGATSTPVGIVYDYDGTVTDALLGSGAGSTSQCFFNAAFGGVDNFSPSANIEHALVVLNGQCALQPSQLTDVEYRLVKVLGSVLGVAWSQVNPNVITGNPHPTSDDFAGFPLMHYKDPQNCVPITLCYPNPLQPAMDDAAAISRLYPVTVQNQSGFPGKQIFSTTTARIHGSVWFADSSGKAAQAMQGVNVVARWIDPTTGSPSRKYAASSVSGFLFSGNAGNPITGFVDPLGIAFSQWGSSDQSVEGFFDLAGLQFPGGGGSGQYQLSVEGLDPLWAAGVAPYLQSQVAPSGALAPILVNVATGVDVAQDIVMTRSAQPVPPWAASETWSAPAVVPPGGDWVGSLSGYGNVSYFSLPAQANRTLSVAVTALDEAGNASVGKAQPVIGMWASSDPPGTPPPAFTPSSFNSVVFGETRLDAQIFTSTGFLVGISDLRGDGRPDYHYHAHVLYADTVSPTRISVNGAAVAVRGMGFAPGLTATSGSGMAPVLAADADQMVIAVPAQGDGLQSLTITDPVSGAFSIMTGVLTYGAAADDNIVLLQGTNPSTPVGTQATNPVMVRAVAADGMTLISGATVAWSTTNGATLSACGGAPSCSVATDESGVAWTWVTPVATGVATITAALAPAVYNPAKSVAATLLGTSSATDIGVSSPYLWIAQGATVTLPLTARVMSNGTPQVGITVNFTIVAGSGTLSTPSATTDANGYATDTLTLTQIAANVRVNACVAPANAPCQNIFGSVVAPALQSLQPVTGTGQAIALGQAFQPVTVRVVDNSSPPNPVVGSVVAFQSTVMRPVGDAPGGGSGETGTGNPAQPVILGTSLVTVQSDGNGLASIVPSVGAFNGTLEVDVLVTAGTNAMLQYVLQAFPAAGGGSPSAGTIPPRKPVAAPVRMRLADEEP
jgi:hypothetical protein